MRLIDADSLFNDLADYWGIPKDWDGQIEQTCEDALCAIENAPEVDAVPVVHGEWIEHEWAEEENGVLISNFECSACQNWEHKESNYCPNCGAKMGGDI